MGRKEVFHSDDDIHRLPLIPSGNREYCGSDGVWSAHAEHASVFNALAQGIKDLVEAPIPRDAGASLAQLQRISKLRSMLDAAEAVVLADGYELAHHDTQHQASDNPLEEQNREFSAARYGVDPSNESAIRSSFVAEVATACRETPRRAEMKLMFAEALRNVLPATLAALGQGEITTRSATTIVQKSQDLEPEKIGQLESVLLPTARTASDDQVSDKARRLRAKLLPEPVQERRERRESERCVRWWTEDDGMATVQAYLKAEDAMAIMNTLGWHAAQEFKDDDRTEAQVQADIFRDVILDGWPEKPGPGQAVKLAVTIPALEMLADPSKALADLEGYGPIPAGVALKLAAKAPSFLRVLTDPWTGAPIDVGRTRYRPPAALKELIDLRDLHCRFPGCRRRPAQCEIDHIEDWAKGGETSRKNNELTCRRHQMFKHALGWQVIYRPDGSVQWRTPHGLVHTELPGSITCAQQFDTDPGTNPPQPAEPAVRVDEKVRRVLSLPEPWPPGPAFDWYTPASAENSS